MNNLRNIAILVVEKEFAVQIMYKNAVTGSLAKLQKKVNDCSKDTYFLVENAIRWKSNCILHLNID